MKKLRNILAVLCCIILLFGSFAACTPTSFGSGSASNSTDSASNSTGDSTKPEDSTGGNSSSGGDSSTGGSSSTGGNASTGGNSWGGGSISKPDVPYDEEEAKLYSYRPQITAEMPAVRINTTDGKNDWATKYNRQSKLNDEIDYVDATITVNNCQENYQISNVAAEVKVRGNYTLDYEKKPIRIKFNKKNNMLGLNDGEKYKNWVLLADWKDLSMTNNTVAYYLGNTILGSDGYYCTDFRNVEVYLNGQYWGVYLLVEQQEAKEDANEGRTSIPEVEDDYTGTDIGYLFEYDGYYGDEDEMERFEMTYCNNSQLQMLNGGWVTPVEPRALDAKERYWAKGYTLQSDIYVMEQKNFIQSYMDNVYKIAYEAVYNNKFYKFNDTYTALVDASGDYSSAKQAVSAVIDLQSLVDAYILNEIACDLDISWSSFYMGVDMSPTGNKKVVFEAPWDFDSCFGIVNGVCNSGTGMYAANSRNPWLILFIRQSWFQDMIKTKWNKLVRYGVLDTALELVNEHKNTYTNYYTNNYNRWPSRLYGNGEVIGELNAYNNAATAQGLAADYLYRWLSTRFDYLNSQWITIEVDENIPEGATVYKFEAENAVFGGGLSAACIRTNRDYASNRAYAGDLGGAGKTLTFTVTATEATTAYLFAGVSKRATQGVFGNWFTVQVNGKTVLAPVRYVDAISAGEDDWHTFVSVKIAPVELQAGSNTVVFTTVNCDTNFDYFELYSTVKLS